MGNKVCSILSISQKKRQHNRLKGGLVESTTIPDDDDVFFTPKSLNHIDEAEEHHDHDHDNHHHQDYRESLEIAEVLPFLDSETDYCDLSQTFVCEFCVEPRSLNDSFNLKNCTHFYCTDCTIKYVASKLEDNVTSISCPVSGCRGVLDPEFCREILPEDMFDRWGIALCESGIDSSQKCYCPFKDCSALLINDTAVEVENTECPFCKREFCVKCKVAWHTEISCQKFQKLKKKGDDSMLADLAKRKKWRRCPKCKFYVERTIGCHYMKCRCGFNFCYRCGARSSTTSHVCPKCKY